MEVRGLRFILHAAAASRDQTARTFEFIAPNESEFAFWMGLSASTGVSDSGGLDRALVEVVLTRCDWMLWFEQNSRSANGRSQDPADPSPVSSPALLVLESDALGVFSEEKTTDCVICYDAQQSVVCVPCGHIAMCSSCAHQVVKTTHVCPMCRVPIREIVRFFRA